MKQIYRSQFGNLFNTYFQVMTFKNSDQLKLFGKDFIIYSSIGCDSSSDM